MNISILDDYQNIVSKLDCYKMLEGQDVQVLHETEKDVQRLAQKLVDTTILVLTRERTEISEELLWLLPNLKLISQTGKISNHLNLHDCTKYKVAVAEGTGSPIAPAELTWGLMINKVRKITQAIERMREGKWQFNFGSTVHGKQSVSGAMAK